MAPGDGTEGRKGVAGMQIEDAVDSVVDGDESLDRSTVRAALGHVAEDGVVSPDAAEETLAETATVVSTPETRAELAATALEDAREAAAPVEDLGVVRSRLEGFESRLSAIEERVAALGTDLQALVERDLDAAALFDVGREIQRIRYEANELQRAADDLQFDCEEFETWLDDPSVRADELAADVDAVAESLSGLAETLDAVESLEGETDDPAPERTEGGDPGEAWAEASINHRVAGLLLADLRAELGDLRTMADRTDAGENGETDGDENAGLADVEAHITAVEDRRSAIGDRLDALARPAWRERFDDRLAAVDAVLEDFEPPVAWGDLQVAIDDAQS